MKLYGVPLSQPVRAVQWALAWHKTPHDFVMTMPGSKKGTRSPDFLANINPTGTVPALVEDDGYTVWESHAIMVYLAEKYSWEDLYPKDPKMRGIIQQWLNWHHRNIRQLTLGLFAPKFRPDIKRSEDELKKILAEAKSSVAVVEEQLGKTKFLAGSQPTLADIAAYQEIGQAHRLDLHDFSNSPNCLRWIHDCEQLPGWKEAHEQPYETAKGLLAKMKSKM
jgi:glutathione S-transferase